MSNTRGAKGKVTKELCQICKSLSDAGANSREISKLDFIPVSYTTVYRMEKANWDFDEYRRITKEMEEKISKSNKPKKEGESEGTVYPSNTEMIVAMNRIAKAVEKLTEAVLPQA